MKLLLVNINSFSDIITNSSSEIFLVRSNYSPNDVLPPGFPFSLRKFPVEAFNAWAIESNSEGKNYKEIFEEDDTLKNDQDLWIKLFQALNEELISEDQKSWSASKINLFKSYLVSPKSRNKVIIDEKIIYPPLNIDGFSLWINLTEYVLECMSPRNKYKYSDYDLFSERFYSYQERVTLDGDKMTPLNYAEFLCYDDYIDKNYSIEFIKNNKVRFPFIRELVSMYPEVNVLTPEILNNSWFFIENETLLSAKINKFGKKEFYQVLKNIFNNNFHFIRLNI